MKISPVLLGGASFAVAAICMWRLDHRTGAHDSAATRAPAEPAAPAVVAAASAEGPASVAERQQAPLTCATRPTANVTMAVRPAAVAGAIRARGAHESVATASLSRREEVVRLPRRRVVIEPAIIEEDSRIMSVAAAARGLEIELAEGAREPLALVEEGEHLTAAQERAVAEIANEFAAKVEQAAGASEPEHIEQTWRREQERADAEYYALFGVEAFNRRSAEVGAAAVTPVPSPAAEQTR